MDLEKRIRDIIWFEKVILWQKFYDKLKRYCQILDSLTYLCGWHFVF